MIGAAVIAAGVLLAAGLYLMLSRDVQLVAMGFFLLSNGVNLFVLTASGMPVGAAPPLIPEEDPAAALARPTADPLAQAFILAAAPVFAHLERTATTLLEVTPYVDAVLVQRR
ncbi:NADH-quinone oxidoreductase subunit K [Sorangium sp. So ce302]|uniref:NADH-quinone oxidoreductase subunit K n=1 Tax=Sorangium sp. So ce302 TaxID=3133297 RepID=UPI003F5D7286